MIGWHFVDHNVFSDDYFQMTGYKWQTIIPHLHDTTACQTRWTTGCTTGWMFVYKIQPGVQPAVQLIVKLVKQLAVSFKRDIRDTTAMSVITSGVGKFSAAKHWGQISPIRIVRTELKYCKNSTTSANLIHCFQQKFTNVAFLSKMLGLQLLNPSLMW